MAGVKQFRSWFTQITYVLRLDGTWGGNRLRNGDKPDQQTFENVLASATFSKETSDRAKVYTGSGDLGTEQGLVVTPTDAQAKANQVQLSDRTLAVAPHQLPTFDTVTDDFTIVKVPADGAPSATQDVFTTTPDSTTTRNNFIIKFALDFKKFIIARIVPVGGNIGDILIKKTSVSNDTEWGDLTSTSDAAILQLFTNLTNNTTFITNLTTTSLFQTAITNAFNTYITSNPSYFSDLEQVGFIKSWSISTPPSSKYLICDGSSLLRSSYPDLFNVIGTIYGAVDGTHFNLPDSRGRQLIGVGGGHALAATGGSETTTISSNNLPLHTHNSGNLTGQAEGFTDIDGNHQHHYLAPDLTTNTLLGAGPGVTGTVSAGTTISDTLSDHQHGLTVDVEINSGTTGDGGFANDAINTLDPYIAVIFVIKALK